MNSQVPRDDKKYVNVIQKFKEKPPSIMEKLKIDKAEAEAKLKKMAEERKAKKRGGGELRI